MLVHQRVDAALFAVQKAQTLSHFGSVAVAKKKHQVSLVKKKQTFHDLDLLIRGAQEIKNLHYRFPKWWISYWENNKSP